jgi:hypothetical protein
VNKDVPRPVARLDKSEALLAVEPLHGSLRHKTLSLECTCNQGRAKTRPLKSEIWEKFVGLTQGAEAKSFGRTRSALVSVFPAASQEGSTLTERETTGRDSQFSSVVRHRWQSAKRVDPPHLISAETPAPVGVAPFLPFLRVSFGRARRAQIGS